MVVRNIAINHRVMGKLKERSCDLLNEIVVISGKGGTGKTSILASLAFYAKNAVLADCDVDAADLHLLLAPKINEKHDFLAGNEAWIDPDKCNGCGLCYEHCRFDAIVVPADSSAYSVNKVKCEGCGVCAFLCPEEAIELRKPKSGELFFSETKYGSMVHAKLGIAAENSGRLVALVREKARTLAESQGSQYILVDGPPGIGCPVISAITGADAIVIVTEPTMSGLSDMKRVADLAAHFRIPASVCINKFDLNHDITEQIAAHCRENHLRLLGRIPYDDIVTRSQIAGVPIPEFSSNGVSTTLRSVWEELVAGLS